MSRFIADACINMRPEAGVSVTQGNITWSNIDTEDIPTDAEIQAEVIRLEELYVSQEYARNRKAEYDKLNQFEMQFDDNRDGTTTWPDAINEIKMRYPK